MDISTVSALTARWLTAGGDDRGLGWNIGKVHSGLKNEIIKSVNVIRSFRAELFLCVEEIYTSNSIGQICGNYM